MGVGVVTVSMCVAYIAYINATADPKAKATYTTMDEQGHFHKRERESKWK